MFIPLGSDRDAPPFPMVALILVILCLAASVAGWIAAPASFMEGLQSLRRTEALHRPTTAAGAKEDDHAPTTTWHQGASPAQRRAFDEDCRKWGLDTGFDLITREDQERAQDEVADQERAGDLTTRQANRLDTLLRRLSLGSEAQVALARSIASLPRTDLNQVAEEDLDRLAKAVASAAGKLSEGEAAELRRRLSVLRPVAHRLVYDAWNRDQIPWYLHPVGDVGDPLRWLGSILVHVPWRDALLDLGMLWTFAMTLEQLCGRMRMAQAATAAIVTTGLGTMGLGLGSPILVPVAGSGLLVALLGGVLLAWWPRGSIRFRAWRLAFPRLEPTEYEVPVPLLCLLWCIWQLVALGLVGVPPVTTVLLVLGCTALGYAIGWPWSHWAAEPEVVNDTPVEHPSEALRALRGTTIAEAASVESSSRITRQVPALTASSTRTTVEPPTTAHRREGDPGSSTRIGHPGSSTRISNSDPVRRASTEEHLRRQVREGRYADAAGSFATMFQRWPDWRPEFDLVQALALGLDGEQRGEDCVSVILVGIRLHPQVGHDLHLLAAEWCIDRLGQPQKGLELLEGIPHWALRPTQRTLAQQLRQRAAAA